MSKCIPLATVLSILCNQKALCIYHHITPLLLLITSIRVYLLDRQCLRNGFPNPVK